MKQIFKRTLFIIGMFSLLFTACEDDIDPVIESLDFQRVFTPLNLEADIRNQTIVELDWDTRSDAESYVLEISEDSLDFSNIINTTTVAPEEMPYEYELPAGSTRYSARVKGTSSTIAESNWSAITFKSEAENLFSDYGIIMTGIGDLTLTWTPGKAVTSIVLTSETNELTYDISDAEMEAGEKQLTSVPNDEYVVSLLNDTKTRGTVDYTVEGDVFLTSGESLTDAITAASAGDVILLEAGGEYAFEGDYTIEKAIKIKGLEGDLPVLYTTDGDRMFYIGSTISSTEEIVFENLYMSGYVNNNSLEGQIRGVFDMESQACDIGAVKFIGCKLYYMGRQIMRLRGKSDQTIGEFVIDDCIIHNLGKSSGSYGVFCATETNTNARIVKITNSTIDSLKCHFIRYDDATLCESIIVENCTFYRVPFASGRYLMDVRKAVITDGIYLTNSIFGSTSYGDTPTTVGIRKTDDVTINVSNSYATSDFVNDNYSIVSSLTALGATSTSVWTDPDNGDFTLTDSYDVDAGDPRWLE